MADWFPAKCHGCGKDLTPSKAYTLIVGDKWYFGHKHCLNGKK